MIRNWVRPPRPKRDLETKTTYVRPSNLAARTLRSVEHTPSKFSHDPCPVRRGLVAAVKCCVRKARFFRCPGRLWNKTREARALCGFQHHKGEKKIVFCFPIPQLSALGQQLSYQKTENKTDFPFIVLKPASSAVGSDGSFLFAAYTRKNVFFAHSTSPLPRVLASQNTDHHQTWRAYAPVS